jgi:regulator of nonsense transcripts 2
MVSDKEKAVVASTDGDGQEVPSTDPAVEEKRVINVSKLMLKRFSKIWNVHYSQIPLMADLAAGLSVFHDGAFFALFSHPIDFIVELIDNILEQIRVGMEDLTHFRHQQRRVMTIRYFGELYNYAVISSSVLFDTLYSLLCFGHPAGRPHRDHPSDLDGAFDYFRIRLVCILLDTCGMYFDRGSHRQRLDCYLVYFQHYYLSKNQGDFKAWTSSDYDRRDAVGNQVFD